MGDTIHETHIAFSDDTDMSDDLDSGRSEHMVFVIRESLRRRDNDRVTGMCAQRVKVLHIAADDGVLRGEYSARGHLARCARALHSHQQRP